MGIAAKTCLALALCQAAFSQNTSLPLPRVDLRYEVHEALSFNESSQLYNFSNIRYAQPPTGNLRFAAPVPPVGRNPTIQKGAEGRVCPQAEPDWQYISDGYILARANNISNFSVPDFVDKIGGQAYFDEQAAGRSNSSLITEDCLFLDVVVPKDIFDGGAPSKNAGGAPVLVWIFAGGYVEGNKVNDGSHDPTALIQASQENGEKGFVYVSINYRLGALGWSSGPSFEAAGGIPNAGLHDQRLALQWIQNNIHLFGGDPNQVTLGGDSAGGGSVMHQITAYGGLGPSLFQRAWSISGGFYPVVSQYVQENTTQTFLKTLNVSTIEEARAAPFDAINRANIAQVRAATYGTFAYGPVVDGSLVPALPGTSLLQGNFDHNISSLLLMHAQNEGMLFYDPRIQTDEQFAEWLKIVAPAIQPDVVNTIVKELYAAPAGDGRTIPFLGDFALTCLTNYVARAFDNQTYNSQFSIYPAVHSSDLEYAFDWSLGQNLVVPWYPQLADQVKQYVAGFILRGDPNSPGLPPWPQQGGNASHNSFTIGGIVTEQDPSVGPRCEYLQKALFY